ncbi:MAG: ClpX C4-type zinc finger protein [Vicinamibacteria bacterium]|nr:ClpX C4-type zinc finger protein [Vicinamibacteria bacterium]
MDEATAVATGIWFKAVRFGDDGPFCSFWPLPEDMSEWVIVSRQLSICGWCVEACQETLRERAMDLDQASPRWKVASHLQNRPCGFCGRPPEEVGSMLAHPIGSICDRCLTVCAALLAEAQGGEGAGS